jgi:hypothetical protein
MRYWIYICFAWISVGCSVAQFNPEPKKVTDMYFPDVESIQNVTPALKKKKGFTNYVELMAFLNEQQAQHPTWVEVKFIGKSQKGLDIPIVFIKNPNSDEQKIRVWLQGGLHGNEPASTEGMLYFIYQILNDPKWSYLLNRMEIAVVPMANIDGYLKLDRYAANGLDLNRDQTKLMAPESVVLKKAFSDFNAHVALDFHEYNPYRKDFAKLASFGITSAYDVMFLYSNNLNVPENMRKLIDTCFVEDARKAMDANKLRHHDYISTQHDCGEIHFRQGSTSARSSASSYALTNAVSALIEVRGVNLGRTSFKRRINTTFLVAMSFLETAYKNIDLIHASVNLAVQTNQDVVVTSTIPNSTSQIKAIDLDKYELIDLPITVKNAKDIQPKLTRPQPDAYLLSKELGFIAEKLRVLGLTVQTLEQDISYEVEVYTVSTYTKDQTVYEKMFMQTVTTTLSKRTIVFPKGSFMVYTNQKNKGLLFEVLEPEAPSSFVSFGVLPTALNQELPIYRYFKPNNIQQP